MEEKLRSSHQSCMRITNNREPSVLESKSRSSGGRQTFVFKGRGDHMRNRQTLITLTAGLLLSGCGEDPDERYDSGRSDGCAAGYNTTCNIRDTMIEADWDSQEYTQGYNRGYMDGSAACLADKD